MSRDWRSVLAQVTASPVRLAAVLIATAILVSLGTWQLQRLEWKRDLIAKAEARVDAPPAAFAKAFAAWGTGVDQEYAPVAIEGVYRHDLETHVFGTYDGEAGYYIFAPIIVATDGASANPSHVYINRGFVPQALKAAASRADGLAVGTVRVTGLFRAPEATGGLAARLRPPNDIAGNVWHVRSPSAFATAQEIDAAPIYIDSFGEENAGAWPKGGVTRLSFSNRHFEYALTWFGLAGALWAVFLAYAFTRR